MDIAQITAAAAAWDRAHHVTATWRQAASAAATIDAAERDFDGLVAHTQRQVPDRTVDPRTIAAGVTLAQLRLLECRTYVQRSLSELAASGPVGPYAARMLRSRLKLRALSAAIASPGS